jgi:glycosyltransferase involved in cell wall biosynthesis
VLFVGRTRYRLPLDASQARKWDALGERLDLHVLATTTGSDGADPRFTLVPDLPLGAYYAALPVHVARAVRRLRPDVIVAQSPYEAIAVLPARGRAKLLLEVHGDWATASRLYGSPVRKALEPVSLRLARLAVRRADAVRTLSPFTTELVRGLGVEPAATFTAYVDTSAFTGSPPVPLPDEPSALFVGVLERYKNVAGLAAAWQRVAERLPAAKLVVVGSGRETEVVQRLGVTWHPRLSSDEVAAALDVSSLLVLPSFSEGLPRVAMEAFARGRPVVGSRAGGIPDIVEDGVSGLLVEPGDDGALAGALLRALSDRALLERLAAGAAEASGRWRQTPEDYAERMEALVRSLL